MEENTGSLPHGVICLEEVHVPFTEAFLLKPLTFLLRKIPGYWCLGVLVLVGLCSGGCREPDRQILLIGTGREAFWTAAQAGAEAAANNLGLRALGLKVVVRTDAPSSTEENKKSVFQQAELVALGVSALAIGNQVDIQWLDKARQAGLPIITLQTDVPAEQRRLRLAFVGTSPRTAGEVLGMVAKTLLPKGGGFVSFVDDPTSRIAQERIGGFAQAVGASFQELDSLADENDPHRSRENVRSALLNHGEKLKVLLGVGPESAEAIPEVVRQEQKREGVIVLVFDAPSTTLQQIGEGMIDAAVVEDPYTMGYEAVRLLVAFLANDPKLRQEILPKFGQADGDRVELGLKVVVPDIGSPLTQEVLTEKAQLFHLGEFRQWLYQRNLSGL